jgi:WSC domain-containing protein
MANDRKATQTCGGPGGYIVIYYDSTKYDPATGKLSGPTASPIPSVPSGVAGYSYSGCWSDAPESRSLNVGSVGNRSNMSLENCATLCSSYTMFGTEYAEECYCGNGILASAIREPVSDCNMPCTGNSSELCGAGNRLSLFFKVNTTTPPTVALP